MTTSPQPAIHPLMILLFAVISSSAGYPEDIRLLDRPAYPLYTISSKKIDLTEEDASKLAENFQFLHGKFSPEQFDMIRRVNPQFKCLVYVNSTYTRNPEDVGVAESKYRRSLCMHLSARLVKAIGPGETRLEVASTEEAVKRGASGPAVAIRASTVEGGLSSSDRRRPSARHYVFWIRVGEELMRVDAVDEATGRIEVTRGFDGTIPASHPAGANVFSPVYLGFKRTDKEKHPGQYPGGPGEHLRYVYDPHQEAGYSFLANLVLDAMQSRGTDGCWLDTLNVGDFNLSDCMGRPVRPWNFRKGEVYRPDDFRAGQERKIAFVQEFIRQRLGKHPWLVANNLKPTTYYPGDGGMRRLLESTDVKPRPLDGFCMEGGLGWHRAHDEPEELLWRERIQILMDAAQNGLAAMPILGGAGAKSVLSEPDTPERDRAERFGYASYLLAVEKDGRTLMGTYAFYQADGRRTVRVHRMYYYAIGEPAETVAPKDIGRYLVPGTPVYRRSFTGGLVLVNPSETEAQVSLETTHLDPDQGTAIDRIVMPAGSGKILLKR